MEPEPKKHIYYTCPISTSCDWKKLNDEQNNRALMDHIMEKHRG